MKAKRIPFLLTGTTKNIKRSFSGRRNVMPEENMDLYKGMKKNELWKY